MRIEEELEMIKSLIDACEKAGGRPFDKLEDLHHMTVMEMIQVLATNGIRFTNKRHIEPLRDPHKCKMCGLGLSISNKTGFCTPVCALEYDQREDFVNEDEGEVK